MGRSASRGRPSASRSALVALALLAAFNALKPSSEISQPRPTGETPGLHRPLVCRLPGIFVAVLVLLVRNVLKLYADQRKSVMGTAPARTHVVGAALISLIPLCFMFFYSYGVMNRSVDRWFSQNPNEFATIRIAALELAQYTLRARRELSPSPRHWVLSKQHTHSSARRAAPQIPIQRPSEATCSSTRSPCRMDSQSLREGLPVAAFHCRDAAFRACRGQPWLPDTLRR